MFLGVCRQTLQRRFPGGPLLSANQLVAPLTLLAAPVVFQTGTLRQVGLRALDHIALSVACFLSLVLLIHPHAVKAGWLKRTCVAWSNAKLDELSTS